MSYLSKQKIESRQKNKKFPIKNKNVFSLDTLGDIVKEKTTKKKFFKDLSLNYLKNYTIPTHQNNTCINNSHKKIIIKEISKPSHNKKIFNNLNKAKFKKYPLKLNLNYKQSKSLKDLLEEEKLLNLNLRPNHTIKNTNTRIELFSTNSTLSFLNIKDSNKEISKIIKNENSKNKNNKKFCATFFENKIKQYIKFNSNLKNKKQGLKNKSTDFFSSYKKNINKNRNTFLNNENSNTNSTKEFYNINISKKNINSTNNLLLDNISFSLNKNKISSKSKLVKNRTNSKYNRTCSIKYNNKKLNLCSLPNLLCNNYIFNYNDKNNLNIKKYKNRNSYQNLLEHKRRNKNLNKISKIIDSKKLKNIFKDFKTINRNNKETKKIKNCKSEKKIIINKNDIGDKLKKIETNVQLLLNGFYSIYLNSKHNEDDIKKSNINDKLI